MSFFKWSRTAANNATADSTCPFPEGMAPSALNDGTRGMMAAAAKYRDDIAGAIVTGGTSTAYTVFSYEGFGAFSDLAGQVIGFTPHATNGSTVTLNVDSLGVRPLRSAPGTELVAGTLVQGTPYVAVYNNVDGAFYLRGFISSPYNIPLLGGLDYWDTVTPNSSFIFPAGQAISRTVYAAAFARWGTKFGAGDGSTTFNVPDKTGRVSAMMESAASRLSATYFGGNSTQIGAIGGAEKETLITANLPAYTPSGSVDLTFLGQNLTLGTFGAAGGGATVYSPGGSPSGVAFSITGATASFTGTAQGGTSAPVVTVQPTIVCNYILRII